MRKFLILGIGNAQVDIIRFLKNKGNIELHALSNTSEGRGYQFVDFFDVIDITDKAAVLAYVKLNNIDFIYSVGSDVAMPTVMWVAEQQGLKHYVSSETAILCNTKHELRYFLDGVYGAVPSEELTETCVLKSVTFPAMVKPVDSQGQRGVSTVSNGTELLHAYEYAIQFSRSKKVIIENKIIGPEISVNVFLVEGELVFFLPSGRMSWKEFDGGVIHKHLLPVNLNEDAIANLRRLVVETLEKLEILDGPAYFQIIMDGDTPYLIEVTPRLDGCHMWKLINESTGVNLLEASVDFLLGGDIKIPKAYSVQPGVLEFICQVPGSLFLRPSLETKGLNYLEYYYDNNETVRKMNGKMEKCGYFIRMGSE